MKIEKILILSAFMSGAISACSSGSSSSGGSTQVFASVKVPTTTYASKFALYTSVAGGPVTLTEIDTGSDFLLIESSYVGSNIVMTNESITYTYDHGTNPRSGYLGYTTVSFLNGESGGSIISTNNQVPVIVVADGVVNPNPKQNHAILGLRMDSNVSAKLFLPYPYNQAFIFDAPKSEITFGYFTESQLADFGNVQLSESSCNSYGVSSSASPSCWNDMAVPVDYIISGAPNPVIQYNSLFDSGASSSFQFSPLPSWLDVNKDGNIVNTIKADIVTSLGVMPIYLTDPVAAYDSNYNGGIVNVGNNIFNYYQVLFDQQSGNIGLNRIK